MNNTKQIPWQARQGDILLERVEGERADGQEVPREQGAVVLAYGESSGHRHQITAKGAKLFERGSTRMLEISARGGAILEVATDRGEKLNPPRHTEVPVQKGTFEIVRQREWTADDDRQVQD